MRFSVFCTAGVFAAVVGAKSSCSKPALSPGGCILGKCFRAINEDTPASIGEAFCSSYLSLDVTTTVTVVHDQIVSTTHTNSEASTTTVLITAATVTTNTGTVTEFIKRAEPSDDPTASILSVCKNKPSRISSVCSCLLPSASAVTSTLVIEDTATYTSIVEYTTTKVDTDTVTVTATVNAIATDLVQPIINGNFQGANMLPWTDTSAQTGGKVEHIVGGNVCVDTGSNCHSSTIIRVTPPITGVKYTAIIQTFRALPSTAYKLSILLNSRYGGSSAGGPGIQVLYQGVNLGTFDCNANGVELYFKTISVWEFTTDSSGVGQVEIRILNRSGSAGAYFYLDDIAVFKK
ncbi:hypothetical protein B0T25DRAFT_562256 [Lasiosphaeria hispida]|uniref:CBM-cenC domain-containing protein n=1 Tax=Lasiosphaeria hispida TaxID=260671 RepID=A0AAJ0HUN8_9PEZI|nr:hypothetical protein B0T25DRAFT_562256 [Lasiosphaeria hispida]